MFRNLIEKAYADTSTVWPNSVPSGGPGTIGDYNTLLKSILVNIVNPLVTLMVGVAVLYFLWGVFDFVRNAESSEKRKVGGMHMLWGALGIFIMVTAYGVLNLIIGTVRQ
jgi:hypothetical protein